MAEARFPPGICDPKTARLVSSAKPGTFGELRGGPLMFKTSRGVGGPGVGRRPSLLSIPFKC